MSTLPDVDAWRVWPPADLFDRLGNRFLWAVAGGLALDLHFEVEHCHEDTDISVNRADGSSLQQALAELSWAGKRPGADPFEIGEIADDLSQIWGYEPSACVWRLDVFLEPWSSGASQLGRASRPVGTAVELTPEGIPYLAPEIVLLFKADTTWHPKSKRDLPWALKRLQEDKVRTAWFCDALEITLGGPEWNAMVSL
jgi:hypothetical protein